MEIKEFVDTGTPVLDLSFINKDLKSVCGLIYAGRFPIINISSMTKAGRNKLYPGFNKPDENWGLLDGRTFEKIPAAEAELFEMVKPDALSGVLVPIESVTGYVMVIQSAPRAKKTEWLGSYRADYSDEYRRENKKPLLKGYDLEVALDNQISLLKRGQI